MEGRHAHPYDPAGRRVRILVGLIGIGISVGTIDGHRAHTEAVLLQTQANDRCAYYRTKRIPGRAAETAGTLVELLASDPAKAAAQTQTRPASAKCKQDADDFEAEARPREPDARRTGRRALGLDRGEGLTELGLVPSSLYFLGRWRVFPVAGITAAVAGGIRAIAAFY